MRVHKSNSHCGADNVLSTPSSSKRLSGMAARVAFTFFSSSEWRINSCLWPLLISSLRQARHSRTAAMDGSLRSSTSQAELTSCLGCMTRRSRSADQGGNAATTTSWSKCFGSPTHTRRCKSMPTAMAGRLRSAWHGSRGELPCKTLQSTGREDSLCGLH